MAADISPFRVGQTFPPAHYTFRDGSGAAIPLPTGTTFTMYIYNPANNTTVLGQGTWTSSATSLANGQADYAWNAADSATVGSYQVFVGFITPSGQQGFSDANQWDIVPIFYQR